MLPTLFILRSFQSVADPVYQCSYALMLSAHTRLLTPTVSWFPIFLPAPPPARFTLHAYQALNSPLVTLAPHATTAPQAPALPLEPITFCRPQSSQFSLLLALNVQHDPQLPSIHSLLKLPKFPKFYTLLRQQIRIAITAFHPTSVQGFPTPYDLLPRYLKPHAPSSTSQLSQLLSFPPDCQVSLLPNHHPNSL